MGTLPALLKSLATKPLYTATDDYATRSVYATRLLQQALTAHPATGVTTQHLDITGDVVDAT